MPRASKPPRAALRVIAAGADEQPDEALLRRFVEDRDEGSFRAIVRRHGGMVLDVCRSVLRNSADADDAFQATFLALAANAGAIRTPAALAGWLHVVVESPKDITVLEGREGLEGFARIVGPERVVPKK